MEQATAELARVLRVKALYETFRVETEATIYAFNAGAITREEMTKRFTFADERLTSGLGEEQ